MSSIINLSEWSAGPSNEQRFEYYSTVGNKRIKLGHISCEHRRFIKEGKECNQSIYNVYVHFIAKTGTVRSNTKTIVIGLIDLDECKRLLQDHCKGYILDAKQKHDLMIQKLEENAAKSK